jgi:hypothetical protein
MSGEEALCFQKVERELFRFSEGESNGIFLARCQ